MIVAVVLLEAFCVSGLLWAIRNEKPRLEAAFKAAASLVFLGYGLSGLFPLTPFGLWIALGLLAALAGDLFLLRESTFLPGLVAFLLCHLAYAFAFSRVLTPSLLSIGSTIPILLAATAALIWLWPYCGRLRGPVSIYILAISLMTIWALSAFQEGRLPMAAPAGAILFFVSDLFVARHRFIQRQFLNRFLGLPLYYASQLLMASLIAAGS